LALLLSCVIACVQLVNAGTDGASILTSSSEFFHDGRDGDLRSIWAFGVNGFFIPPAGFAGIPGLGTSGTIIPTSAVGLLCFDGNGGCSLELSAVVGGNLGNQVFNVTMNRVRFVSSICRVSLSRLGRATIVTRLSEVSTRLLPATALALPIVVIAQLTSPNFAFIEFDTLFVMQGQAIKIQRFSQRGVQSSNKDVKGSPPSAGPGPSGPGSLGGPGGPGGKVDGGGGTGGGLGSSHRDDDGAGDPFNGVCPNLIDNTGIDGLFGAGLGVGLGLGASLGAGLDGL